MGSRPKLKLTITTMLKSSSTLLFLLLPVCLDAVLVENHLSVLRHKLLENGVYDKNVKPDGKINVKVGFSLIDLDLHPKTQTLETHGWTYISWNDPRLAWDKLDYDGIDRIRIHQKEHISRFGYLILYHSILFKNHIITLLLGIKDINLSFMIMEMLFMHHKSIIRLTAISTSIIGHGENKIVPWNLEAGLMI